MELTVAKRDLLKLVTRMQGVAERKSTMPVLSNALLAVDGPNALRLSKMEVDVAGRQASATMLIPLKAIQELRRLCDEAAADAKETKDAPKPQVQITQSGSSAFFQGAGMSFSVKLVDAQFPPYAQ